MSVGRIVKNAQGKYCIEYRVDNELLVSRGASSIEELLAQEVVWCEERHLSAVEYAVFDDDGCFVRLDIWKLPDMAPVPWVELARIVRGDRHSATKDYEESVLYGPKGWLVYRGAELPEAGELARVVPIFVAPKHVEPPDYVPGDVPDVLERADAYEEYEDNIRIPIGLAVHLWVTPSSAKHTPFCRQLCGSAWWRPIDRLPEESPRRKE